MDTDKTDADTDIKANIVTGNNRTGNKRTGNNVTGVDGDAGIDNTPADPSKGGSNAPVELNGPKGPEPTRYGDWEQKGRCSDF